MAYGYVHVEADHGYEGWDRGPNHVEEHIKDTVLNQQVKLLLPGLLHLLDPLLLPSEELDETDPANELVQYVHSFIP